MVTRRGFLKGLFAGAATVVAAPAICQVENLMKLYVPSQKLIESAYQDDVLSCLCADFDGDVLNSFYSTELSTQAVLSMKHMGPEAGRRLLDDLANKRLINEKQRGALITRYPMMRPISVSRNPSLVMANREIANEIIRTPSTSFITRGSRTLR